MALDFSVESLIARVRRTCQLDVDNAKLSTDDILQICDEEIQQNLYPRLMNGSPEDYQQMVSAFPLTANVDSYRMPTRCSASTIHHIDRYQISGDVAVNALELSRIAVSRIAAFVGNNTPGVPQAYCVQGDVLRMLPAPDSFGATNFVMLVWHPFRPARLILSTSCATISAAVVTSQYVITATCSTLPGNLTNSTPIDIVPAQPPLMPYLIDGQIISTAGAPSITLFPGYVQTSTNVVAQINAQGVDARLVPAGFTCIFPLPDLWFSAAVLACSASVCRILGDTVGMETNQVAADAAIARLVLNQQNRVRDQPLPVFNRQSYLRRNGRSGYGRSWGGP